MVVVCLFVCLLFLFLFLSNITRLLGITTTWSTRLMLEIQRCFKYLKLLTRGVGRRSVPWVKSWSPCRPCCWKRSRIPRVEKLIEHQESFSSNRWVGRELHCCESSSGSNHKWGFLCALTVLAQFGTPCVWPVSNNHFVIATTFNVF